MDNKKFEKLIDLIINENEEQARALFHDIVVEKSRQIYEGLMDEEMGMDQSMGMLDELSAETQAEEQGAFEGDEEFDDIEVGDDGMGDEEVDLDSEEFGGEEGEEGLEDRVVDLEDKLDQLMAEFEEIMGQEGEEGGEDFGSEEGMDDEQSMMEAKDEEDDEEDDEEEDVTEAKDEEDEEALEEAIQLKKVSVTHGDNGVNTKSIVSGGPKVGGNGASAANLNKGYADSGKGGTQGGVLAPTTKDIKHAGAYGNSPNSFKFKEKGEAAPKAKHGDDGQNTKSIVGEGKKSVKKPVAKTTTKKIVK
jgi:hypothetical protein